MLTTHDLKERGWTLSMIRKLLPEHDDTRENLLDRNYGEVKLYRESRVRDAESTGAFAELLDRAVSSQESAQKAQESKRHNLQVKMQQAVEGYRPQIVPIEAAALEQLPPDQRYSRVWVRHLADLDRYHGDVLFSGQLPRRMSRAERNQLWDMLKVPHMQALKQAYPEVEFPW